MHLCLVPTSVAILQSFPTRYSYLDGVFALWEVHGLLGGLDGLEAGLVLGETASDGTGLLWAEVQWEVLLAGVQDAELMALVGVDDGKDTGNVLADIVARAHNQRDSLFCGRLSLEHWDSIHPVQLGRSAAGHLLNAEGLKLALQFIQLLTQILAGLGPESTHLNFGGGLSTRKSTVSIHP
jgi:hypothetical protein